MLIKFTNKHNSTAKLWCLVAVQTIFVVGPQPQVCLNKQTKKIYHTANSW